MYNIWVKSRNKKGFTLMEMLIVVAIIAILVAIAVPVMNSSLDKAKAATDAANLRTANAIAAVYLLEHPGTATDNADGIETAAAAQGVPAVGKYDGGDLTYIPTEGAFAYADNGTNHYFSYYAEKAGEVTSGGGGGK